MSELPDSQPATPNPTEADAVSSDTDTTTTDEAEAAPTGLEDAEADSPTAEVDEATEEAPPEATEEVTPEPEPADLLPIGTATVMDDPTEQSAAADLDPAEALPVGPEAAAEPEPEAEPQAEVLSEDELVYEKDDAAPVVRPQSPFDKPGRWFVVHTQSGYEKKVKQNLEARTQSMNMEGHIHEVVIPMEDVVEFKGGKKVVVQKKVFPGYLLVRCNLDDDAWYVIRNTPGVTGFVGQGSKPSPLSRRDVETFLAVKPEGEEAPKRTKPLLQYEEGETVRVKEGPFADFSGEVIEINEDQLKVKVLVNIFGRETPVELEFAQVAKL